MLFFKILHVIIIVAVLILAIFFILSGCFEILEADKRKGIKEIIFGVLIASITLYISHSFIFWLLG